MTKWENRAGKILWGIEQERTVHSVFSVELNHEIEPDSLMKALEKTLKIYPIMGKSIVFENEMTYFTDNNAPLKLFHDNKIHTPLTTLTNGYAFAIHYHENVINIAVSHAMTDGNGMMRFGKCIVYHYCCLYYGKDYVDNSVRKEGEVYADDIADFWFLPYEEFQDQEEVSIEGNGYLLPQSTDKQYCYVRVSVPSERFMQYVKHTGSSPAVTSYLLFAKALYNIFPDVDEPIVCNLTTDARKTFGYPNTMLNCSMGAFLSVRREEVEGSTLKETSVKNKALLRHETSPEYTKYIAKQFVTKGLYFPGVNATFVISYMGTIAFGECAEIVRDCTMTEGEFHKMNIYEYGGNFHFMLCFGENSEKFADAFLRVLKEEQIDGTRTENILLPDEISEERTQ